MSPVTEFTSPVTNVEFPASLPLRLRRRSNPSPLTTFKLALRTNIYSPTISEILASPAQSTGKSTPQFEYEVESPSSPQKAFRSPISPRSRLPEIAPPAAPTPPATAGLSWTWVSQPEHGYNWTGGMGGRRWDRKYLLPLPYAEGPDCADQEYDYETYDIMGVDWEDYSREDLTESLVASPLFRQRSTSRQFWDGKDIPVDSAGDASPMRYISYADILDFEEIKNEGMKEAPICYSGFSRE